MDAFAVIIKKAINAGGFYELDFSEKEDANYFIESSGGEENLRQKYPRVYASFLKEKKITRHKIASRTKNAPDNDKEKEGVYINSHVFDKAGSLYKVKSSVAGFLPDPDIGIKDLSNGKVARAWRNAGVSTSFYNRADPSERRAGGTFYSDDVNAFAANYTAKNLPENIAKYYGVVSDLRGFDPNNKLRTFVAVKDSSASLPIVLTFKAEHPCSSSGNNPITMYYGRSGTADYSGGQYYDNSPKGNKFKTLMPIAGTIEFARGTTFTADILRKPTGKGTDILPRSRVLIGNTIVAKHLNSKNETDAYNALKECFTVDLSGANPKLKFNIKFDNDSVDWCDDMNGVGSYSNKTFTYMLNACFDIDTITPSGVSLPTLVTIYSVVKEDLETGEMYYTSNDPCVYVPPISVFWGCFAKDTLIRLANGDDKPIDTLEKGDTVITQDGRVMSFTESITGHEEQIFSIKTANGAIRLTGAHPIMLGDGTISIAANILVGQTLKTPEGEEIVTEVSLETYNDTVISPVFEESGEDGVFIQAGGFYCGDNKAQNRHTAPIIVPRTPEDIALFDEFQRLCMDSLE